MKFFAAVIAGLFLIAASVRAADNSPPMVGSGYGGGSSSGGSYGGSSGGSYGGSSGGASIPAPPCPKNYIISCQPSLNAAPCASQSSGGYGGSSSGGYGSSGAYSANYPVLAVPVADYINGFQVY